MAVPTPSRTTSCCKRFITGGAALASLPCGVVCGDRPQCQCSHWPPCMRLQTARDEPMTPRKLAAQLYAMALAKCVWG